MSDVERRSGQRRRSKWLHAIPTVNIGHPPDKPWIDRLPTLPVDDVIQWA
ncbi:hypothetical protein [Mycobacterium sp. E1747]|nr:hypothetical protein [Mycobacterium sp. E1747]